MVGPIEIPNSRSINTIVGNSSTTVGGTLQIWATTVNLISNTVLRNNGAGSSTLTIQDTAQSGGNKTLALSFNTIGAASAVIDASKDIVISSQITTANGGITKIGTGKLTLSGSDTYTGDTVVSAGTLALGVGGSIASSPNIKLAASTTFDVSAISFSLGAAQTIARTGAGTATIVGGLTMASGSKASFDAASGSVGQFSAAALTLNNNTITIAVSGSALGIGTYRLFDYTSKSGSFIASPTITGLGLAAGTTARVTEDTVNKHIDLLVGTVPTIVCPSINDLNTDLGLCTASVAFSSTTTGSPTPGVNCVVSGGPLPIYTPVTSPFNFPKGTTTVFCGATNALGSASCTFTVTVLDNQGPVISLNGAASTSVCQGGTYTELGAVAVDNWGG
jgi:autotransporter-associated beta strand protein